MRKILLCILILSNIAVSGLAEGSNSPVTWLSTEEGISIFCLNMADFSDIPIDGHPCDWYFDEAERIDRELRSLLNQKELDAFYADYEKYGYAETEVCRPSMANAENGELGTWLSDRSINDCWVLMYFSHIADVDMSTLTLQKITLKYEEGVLTQTEEGKMRLEIQPERYWLNTDDFEIVNQKDGSIVALYALEEGAVACVLNTEYDIYCWMDVYIENERIADTSIEELSEGKPIVVCALEESEAERIRSGDYLWLTSVP